MARVFDGDAANYLYTDTVPVTSLPIRMSCMFTLNSVSVDQTLLFFGDKNNYAQINCWQVRFLTSTKRFEFITADESTTRTLTSDATYLTAGVWTYITVAGSGTNRSIRVGSVGNGSAGALIPIPSVNDRFAIGLDDNLSASEPLDGIIAEVAVWSSSTVSAAPLGEFSPPLVQRQNLDFYAPLIGTEDQDIASGSALTLSGSLSTDDHPFVRRPAPF